MIKNLHFSGVDAKIMNSLKQFLVDYHWADTLNLNEVKSLIDSLDLPSDQEEKFDLIEKFYLKLHQEWVLNDGWAHQNDIKILHNVLGLPEYNQKFYDFQTAHANPVLALKLGKAADDGNCYLISTLLGAQCAKEHPERLANLSTSLVK